MSWGLFCFLFFLFSFLFIFSWKINSNLIFVPQNLGGNVPTLEHSKDWLETRPGQWRPFWQPRLDFSHPVPCVLPNAWFLPAPQLLPSQPAVSTFLSSVPMFKGRGGDGILWSPDLPRVRNPGRLCIRQGHPSLYVSGAPSAVGLCAGSRGRTPTRIQGPALPSLAM